MHGFHRPGRARGRVDADHVQLHGGFDDDETFEETACSGRADLREDVLRVDLQRLIFVELGGDELRDFAGFLPRQGDDELLPEFDRLPRRVVHVDGAEVLDLCPYASLGSGDPQSIRSTQAISAPNMTPQKIWTHDGLQDGVMPRPGPLPGRVRPRGRAMMTGP